jgi:hypothetical protein
MARVTDHGLGITILKECDLPEIQFFSWCRIDAHAMHQGVLHLSVIEEAHQIVDLLDGESSGGDDNRETALGQLLDERPISRRRAAELGHLYVELQHLVDRGLIEGSAHRDQSCIARCLDEFPVILDRKARREESLHVFVGRILTVVAVDKRFQLTHLQLDGRPQSMLRSKSGHGIDDRETVLNVSLVVVRHLEDEEFVEVKLVHGNVVLGVYRADSASRL